MAQAARKHRRASAPPLDASAVARAYRLERAKRFARVRRERDRRLARLRFWLALTLLTSALVFLSLTVWNEIERLFGL